MKIIALKRKIIDQLKTISTADILCIAFFLGLGVVKCVYFQYTTGLNKGIFIYIRNFKMIINTLGILSIFAALVYLVSGRKRFIALFALDLVLTVSIFADTVYFRYYSNAVTVPVLFQLGLVGSTMDSVGNLIKIGDIIYILDFPLFLAGMFILKRKYGSEAKKKGYTVGRTAMAALLLTVGLTVSGSIMATTPEGWSIYDNNPIISSFGIYYFHGYDIVRYASQNIFANRTLTAEEKKNIITFYHNKTDEGDKYSDKAKGMNVLMVQVEAFQQFMLGQKVNGVDVTPNLDKLVKESLYFNNIYFQIGGGNTSDAEFLSNTSIYPIHDGSVYFRYPSNTYYSLPKKLKEVSYSANVFHANNPSFWNRTEMYKALGFDKFYSNQDFENDESIGWGLTDRSFFRQSLDTMKNQKPFYSFLITLSSHYPYEYFCNNTSLNTGKYEGTFLGNYMKAIHYADESLGYLVKEMKARGLWDNTLLVIYGDHYGVQRDNLSQLRQFIGIKGDSATWQKLQKVPLIIHCPGIPAKTYGNIGGEIDIYPTLANLLGIKPDFAMGKDLLNTSDSYAVTSSGNIITDKFVYFADVDRFYNNDGTVTNGSKENRDLVQKLENQLTVSNSIISKNAFKKLEQADKSYCLKAPDFGSNMR